VRWRPLVSEKQLSMMFLLAGRRWSFDGNCILPFALLCSRQETHELGYYSLQGDFQYWVEIARS